MGSVVESSPQDASDGRGKPRPYNGSRRSAAELLLKRVDLPPFPPSSPHLSTNEDLM